MTPNSDVRVQRTVLENVLTAIKYIIAQKMFQRPCQRRYKASENRENVSETVPTFRRHQSTVIMLAPIEDITVQNASEIMLTPIEGVRVQRMIQRPC